MMSLNDPDEHSALRWADKRSRLPADHPQHISREARELIFSRALARMEQQCDALIAAMVRELGAEPTAEAFCGDLHA